MIAPDLLELLRCPVTRQKLVAADARQLARLNASAGEREPLSAALVRADGSAAYPVRDGIPVLLADAVMVFA